MTKKYLVAVAAGTGAVMAGEVQAAPVSYSQAGSQYKQNFDSLAKTPQDAAMTPVAYEQDTEVPGWLAHHSLTLATGGNARRRAGAGADTTGGFWSFGPPSGDLLHGDRAFGYIGATTTGTGNWGTRFSNDTGVTLDKFTLSYTAEQWHRESANPAQRVNFQYSTNAASIQDAAATWTTVDALSVTAFPQLGALEARNGNDSLNQVKFTNVTVDMPDVAPGGLLWIRWNDINDGAYTPPGGVADGGRDNGMGIDDLAFSMSAVPEPTGLALLALGAAGLLSRRREQQ